MYNGFIFIFITADLKKLLSDFLNWINKSSLDSELFFNDGVE